jgi:hypothetical protein
VEGWLGTVVSALANRRLQPLGHLSSVSDPYSTDFPEACLARLKATKTESVAIPLPYANRRARAALRAASIVATAFD